MTDREPDDAYEVGARPVNWADLGDGFYLVRSQAGFKQAARHFAADRWAELKDQGVLGYPTAYPAVCCFSAQYGGGYYALVARCIHANTLRAALQGA